MKTLLAVLALSTLAIGQTCERAITFAMAVNGGLSYRLPNVKDKWFDKTQRSTSACFTQRGRTGNRHFLIVLANSSSAYSGLWPVLRKRTETDTTPVSGSGTINDTYGSTWTFTYQGTTTTTTTTTTQSNVPYRDTTHTVYAYTYDESGRLVGQASRSLTTRQGGDNMNTLGYNLGAAIQAAGMKERLLDEAVKNVLTAPAWAVVQAPEPAPIPAQTESPAIKPDPAQFGSGLTGEPKEFYDLLERVRVAIRDAKQALATNPSKNDEISKHGILSTTETWQNLRKTFCQLEPQGRYLDLDGKAQTCN